jgi:O-antigen/teichoic acid export membrane protein
MVRRFFRDSAIYVIPAVLSNGMSFFMFPFYAHRFTPREYGAFDLLMLAGTLVGWTVALEIYQAVGRFVAGEKDVAVARSYASTAFWFAVGVYALFSLAVELLATPISHALLGANVRVSLLRIATALMCVQGVLAIAQAQLRWQLRPVAFAIGSALGAVTTIVASGLLVFGAGLGVGGALLGQLIGCAVALAYVLVATAGTFRLQFHAGRCREMLAFSIPLVPSSVGVFLNLYADRLVIQHMRSLSDVGVYGVGNRLAMIISLLLVGFQGAALPLILSRRNDPSTPRDLARILRIFSALALSTFVFLALMTTPLLRVLAAARYQRAAAVVPFLVISVLFANSYIFAPGLSIAKKTKPIALLTVLAGAANLGLALLLVPPLGIVGAGIATATTSLAWFIAVMAASQRYYPAPHNWRALSLALAVVLAFVSVCLLVLPTSRDLALHPGLLGLRLALAVAGSGTAVALSLGRDEIRTAVRRLTAYAWRVRVHAGPRPAASAGA